MILLMLNMSHILNKKRSLKGKLLFIMFLVKLFDNKEQEAVF